MAEGLVLHEQRGLTRRELIYYLKISDRQTERELGRLGDIHAEGMLILGEKPLKPGDIFDVFLELPRTMQTPRRVALTLRFEALWNRPGPKNNTYFESGVRFKELDATQKAIIDKLIALFAMPVALH